MIRVEEFVQRLSGARRSGAGYMAKCPAHDDRQQSLSIKAGERQPLVLFCHAGCETKDILASVGLTVADICEERDTPEFQPRQRVAAAPRATARGVAPATLPTWERPPHLSPDWSHVASYTYRNEDGDVVAVKDRWRKPDGEKSFTWRFPDGHAWVYRKPEGVQVPLYCLPELISAPVTADVYVAEGEGKVDALRERGFVATCTPNGAGAVWREDDSAPFRDRTVFVLADDDAPGEKKAADTASALQRIARLAVVVKLPNPQREKGYDVSDFFGDGGTADELAAIADEASYPREVVRHNDLLAGVLDVFENGYQSGVRIGVPKLDPNEHELPFITLRPPELIVTTGAPGAGKSTFWDFVIAQTSRIHGWRWLVFSAEQFPPRRHAARLLQKLHGKPVSKFGGLTEDLIRSGLEHIRRHVVMVDPHSHGCDFDRLLEIGSAVNARKSVNAILIDPYNTIAATSRPKQLSEHEFVNLFLSRLRAFTQRENVLAVVVAHPTKLTKGSDGEYPVPRPWDISGSANWFNHADVILSLWRSLEVFAASPGSDEAASVELHIQKVRFEEVGRVGMVKLFYNRRTGQYSDRPPSELGRTVRMSA